MDMTVDSPPPLLSVAIAVFIYAVWVGPIGIFVLRKQLRDATGARLLVKTILAVLTALTAPAAAMMVLMVIADAGEATTLLWSLLKNSW